MLSFGSIDVKTFLSEYWQKKPLVIRGAMPQFSNPLTTDELAGLAMEDEIESRLVLSTPDKAPYWQLKNGPFTTADLQSLPPTHWTLLINGMDKLIPELALLFNNFDFIPQWRVDDLMISLAAEQGSVGPHYDNYDVFLYQAQGRRQWSLTTQNCCESNFMPDIPLRIMQEFAVEAEYVLEEGDMLYLPAHVGHHGTALSAECMTFSFGYRSSSRQEIWDSFGDFYSETADATPLYQDPNWSDLSAPALIPAVAWQQTAKLLQTMLDDEQKLQQWFGSYVTRLDQQADLLLPEPHKKSLSVFLRKLKEHKQLLRNSCCRFAYLEQTESPFIQLFINGSAWPIGEASTDLVKMIANQRVIPLVKIRDWLDKIPNQSFLLELWQLQWLEID